VERETAGGNGTSAQMVARVVGVLDAFVDAERDLGVTEIAARLELSKSVVHRLVTALAEAGYLTHHPTTRRYSLGPRAIRIGQAAVGHTDIRQRALPYLRELAAATGETTTLSLLKGDQRVYAEQIESSHSVRQAVQIGAVAQLFAGASGKAMLAFLPNARRLSILRQAASAHLSDGSALDSHQLARELDLIRRRGYATSQNERVQGAASAAAPVFDHHGNVVASLSVAGVTVRHGRKELEQFGRLAAAAAERLSAELGWGGHVADEAAAGA
jgi:IclR family transcriptional regulator, acetate operon repressor